MALKYIGGTLPSIGVYAIVPGLLQRLPSGRWDLNAGTVSSVELQGAGKQYNYAAGGVGIVAGGIVAGPLGALVGGLAPKAFKDDVVQFVIRFHNGDVAHFAGSPGDYRRALNSSYKGGPPRSTATAEPPVQRTEAEEAALVRQQLAAEPIEQRPKDNPDAERLRAELAAERVARKAASQHSIEKVRAQMAAERSAALETAVAGQSRIWFADVAERQYAPLPTSAESDEERKLRDAQNEAFRKQYKKALQVVRKQHEKAIQKDKLSFKERFRLLTEIQKEFDYRTSK